MKIAMISDLHFGVKQSDQAFQKSQLRFFEHQLVEELKMRGIKSIFVLGDIFDTRQAVNVQTLNVVMKLFKDTFADFDVKVIVGNHDLYYKTTTEVHSLVALGELDNVEVFEHPSTFEFGEHVITMLPWITDYSEKIENISEYCFAHLDIVGFMMDRVNVCSNGLTIKDLTKQFKHIYTGHFHTRSHKEIGNSTIDYIGSPYQITRIDAGQDRGCTILDLDTNETELIVNTESIKYVKLTYPELPGNLEELVKNNVIDIEIPYEFSDQSKLIHEYTKKITDNYQVYSINTVNGKKPDETVAVNEDLSGIDLFSLFKSYTEQLTTINKTEIYQELINLYNTFKRRINNGTETYYSQKWSDQSNL